MELGRKIKNYRLKKKLSLKQLAGRANISLSFLCDIEQGRSNPSLETLQGIASALGLSINALLAEPEIVSESAESPDLVRVPILKSTLVASRLLDPANIDGHIYLDRFWLPGPPKLAAFTVPEPSSVCRLQKGDLALVQLESSLRPGDPALVEHERELLIRRVFVFEKQIVLDSGHPGLPPRQLSRDRVSIIGKVIGALINFD